jgi:DNA transformation protein and related proteins
MAKTNTFVTYITEEVLGQIPGITARGMFGGFGLYKDGIIFGLIDNDRLYFKVDVSNEKEYEEKGSKPFTYMHNGKSMQMTYWEVPDVILENRDEIETWLQKSVAVSINSKKKK